MSRIKGRYVAQVELDIDVDESMEGLLPFKVLKKEWGTLSKILRDLLKDEFALDDCGTIKVTEQYSDIYLVEDEE